jgi:hypothetical protein
MPLRLDGRDPTLRRAKPLRRSLDRHRSPAAQGTVGRDRCGATPGTDAPHLGSLRGRRAVRSWVHLTPCRCKLAKPGYASDRAGSPLVTSGGSPSAARGAPGFVRPGESTVNSRNQNRRQLPGLAHCAPPAEGTLARSPSRSCRTRLACFGGYEGSRRRTNARGGSV